MTLTDPKKSDAASMSSLQYKSDDEAKEPVANKYMLIPKEARRAPHAEDYLRYHWAHLPWSLC